MNKWHRETRDGETNMEKWTGMGSKNIQSAQWHPAF